MNIEEQKKVLKAEIDLVDDEKLLWAIGRLLHLDVSDVPGWHLQILRERDEKYGDDLSQLKKWDDVKKSL